MSTTANDKFTIEPNCPIHELDLREAQHIKGIDLLQYILEIWETKPNTYVKLLLPPSSADTVLSRIRSVLSQLRVRLRKEQLQEKHFILRAHKKTIITMDYGRCDVLILYRKTNRAKALRFVFNNIAKKENTND